MKSPRTSDWNALELGLQILCVIGLIACGVCGRLWLETPNFKPVGAVCLFAGLFLRDWRVAWLVPLAVMGISDAWLGGYSWPVALSVYGSVVIYVWIGRLGGRGLWRSERLVSQAAWAASLSLLGSIQFYFLTNLAVWVFSDWYVRSWEGCIACFVAALPFFRWTLTGDLFFFAAPLMGLLIVRAAWSQAQRRALAISIRRAR